MSYVVIMLARNAVTTVEQTLVSILGQTCEPDHICVVNDGSTDGTGDILRRFQGENGTRFSLVNLPDRGYDIRRVPANINIAYATLEARGQKFDCSMISGDDCIYPEDYSETILAEMRSDLSLAIASGDWGMRTLSGVPNVPQGAGRFVREEFWDKVGRRYPVAYGWEAWLIFKALQLGYEVRNLAWLRYRHLRYVGSVHHSRCWGKGMRALGYHPLVALGRVGDYVLHRDPISLSGSMSMLVSYLFPNTSESGFGQQYESSLRDFVRRYHAMLVTNFVSSQISRIPALVKLLMLRVIESGRRILVRHEHTGVVSETTV